jgi:hypothetical protein
MLHALKIAAEIFGGAAAVILILVIVFVVALSRDYEGGGNPFE